MKWDVEIAKHVGRKPGFQLDVAFARDVERLVLFGPSGAGKSLTLQVIAGLLKPERGHVRIGGETMFDSTSRIDVPARERRLGYVFQDYALFAHLTVRQNVSFGLAKGWRNPPRKGFRDSRDERVDAWLARLELDPFGDRYPEQLSGGQRQRTALARALVGEPRAILLDEPFSALDVGLRARLRDELVELQGRLSVPMILITHDPDDARVFAEATIAIESGRVIPSP